MVTHHDHPGPGEFAQSVMEVANSWSIHNDLIILRMQSGAGTEGR